MWRMLRRPDSAAVAEALRLLEDDAPEDRLGPLMLAVALLRDDQIREVANAIEAADSAEGGVRPNIMWHLPRNLGRADFFETMMNRIRLHNSIRQLRAANRFAFYRHVLLRFLPDAFWNEVEQPARELAQVGQSVRLWWLLRPILTMFAVAAMDLGIALMRVALALILATIVLLSPFWLAAGSTLWHQYPFLWQTFFGRVLACSVLLLIGLALHRMKMTSQWLYGMVEVGVGLGVCWTSLSPTQMGDFITVLQIAAGVYVVAQGAENIRAGWSESKPALVRFVELVADLSGDRIGRHLRKALQATIAKHMAQKTSSEAAAS